ncbi:hypothetical protein VA596_50110 [Amycolatopsis sp., V23-08]|uniref:Uncharacterized protein n=1 Tax=Amycolatopsis heterodermiae TaxID=3110235 RepID=A0ABU5RN66_9PSEU|nr:hypothetical protein [Amycolatopsis sp., V23-08]MEA5367767.1 hypothetical protein [Amycolatopsis sp., V23-08]
MNDDLAVLLEGAVSAHGRITISRGPLDDYEAVFDHKTKILHVADDVDVVPAIVGVLRDVVYGPPDRQFAVLAGGATACGLVPEQATDEPTVRRTAFHVVRDAG